MLRSFKFDNIIGPILRGRDIKRYSCTFAELWLICTQTGNKERNIAPVDIEKYPAIKAHLSQFYSKIEKRLDKGVTPYHLRSCAYMDDFSKQKIAWGNLCTKAQYAWVEDAFFVNNPANIIVPGDKYLLAALNSKIADFYLRNLGVTRNGGYFEYKPMFIEKLPIPLLSESQKQPFKDVVEQILIKKSNNIDTQADEQIIDEMFFRLYQLSVDEILFLTEG